MKKYVFPYIFSYGKMDDHNLEIEVKISDEQEQRLMLSAKGSFSSHLYDDEFIRDIYNIVYSAIMDEQRNLLLKFPDMLYDFDPDQDDDFDADKPLTEEMIEKYLDSLPILGPYYPDELL